MQARAAERALRQLREELCRVPERGCACSEEGGWADGPLQRPCELHRYVNAQLDVLDTVAKRLAVPLRSGANEPPVKRDRLGHRCGAWLPHSYAAVELREHLASRQGAR